MADNLSLSLWFQSFSEAEMLPHALSVLRRFPFSAERPGVAALAIYPLSWSEAPVMDQRFDSPVAPEHAVLLAAEFLHDDYAYEFECAWDLWMPPANLEGSESAGGSAAWQLRPSVVTITAQGVHFEDEDAGGHIQVNFGPEAPFLLGELRDGGDALRVRDNVHKLVSFSSALEQNSNMVRRLLHSESEETLAQKLLERLPEID